MADPMTAPSGEAIRQLAEIVRAHAVNGCKNCEPGCIGLNTAADALDAYAQSVEQKATTIWEHCGIWQTGSSVCVRCGWDSTGHTVMIQPLDAAPLPPETPPVPSAPVWPWGCK